MLKTCPSLLCHHMLPEKNFNLEYVKDMMLCINYMTNTRVDVHCVEHVTNMILSSRGCADRICELTTMQETKLGLLRISGPQRYHTFFCVHVIL
jgi:hypothetical protein